MAMSKAKLQTKLSAVVPVATEAAAIENLAEAYAQHVKDDPVGTGAQALTPILAGGVALGKAAMVTALAGMSVSGAAAGKIKAGLQAFWAAVAGGLTTSFASAIAITPPPFSSLNLQAVFDAVTAGDYTQAQAADAIATEIHANVGGGTVTTPGPVVTPIT
jgi:hypothetical protein